MNCFLIKETLKIDFWTMLLKKERSLDAACVNKKAMQILYCKFGNIDSALTSSCCSYKKYYEFWGIHAGTKMNPRYQILRGSDILT